tara:strand:- start:446 stop:598 length:153 start_codon:yes stop_codon:yes gene_type:complete
MGNKRMVKKKYFSHIMKSSGFKATARDNSFTPTLIMEKKNKKQKHLNKVL